MKVKKLEEMKEKESCTFFTHRRLKTIIRVTQKLNNNLNILLKNKTPSIPQKESHLTLILVNLQNSKIQIVI